MANAFINLITKYNSKGMKQLRNDSQKTATFAKKALAGIGIGLAAKAIFDFGKKSIKLSKIQAQAEAQLEQRIKSTGGAAGLTAHELKQMASELQNTTNIGDEATISAQAMLLSFTNIGKDTFPRATKSVLDVATAMNSGATPSAEQLKNTSIQLGKALNDPLLGLSALTRVGVSFSEQQKEQIKGFVKSGETAKAQAMILGELEKKFGGSAEAAREADGGSQALSNSFGDMQEQIGFLVRDLNRGTGATEGLSGAFSEMAANLRDTRVLTGSGTLDDQIASTENAIKKLRALQGRDGLSIFEAAAAADAGAKIEELTVKLNELTQARDAEDSAVAYQTDKAQDIINAINDETAALEEQAKRLEEVTAIRRDFARELIDIDEKAAEDVKATWEDYYSKEADNWTSSRERVLDIRKDTAKDLKKIDRDLQKDLAKLTKDTAKNRAKIDRDEAKQIDKIKRKTANEQRQDSKRKQIDALADERLFNFELQQLAAEGEGNRIKEMIERRAIEEQIAREKASVESEIEQDKQQEEIQRVRETASEKRREQEQDVADRRQQLINEAEDAKALRIERFGEELTEERDNYQKRLEDLRGYRDEKLANIEESKQESIAALGRELAEAGDLTKSELQALVPVAGQFGENAGKSFADGLTKGFDTNNKNNKIAELLGESTGGNSGGRTLTPGNVGLGRNPGQIAGFARGGVVSGPHWCAPVRHRSRWRNDNATGQRQQYQRQCLCLRRR